MPIAKKMYICDSVNLAETASMSKKAPNFVWAKISGEVALHQIPNFMVFLGKCDHSETTSLRDVWLQSVFFGIQVLIIGTGHNHKVGSGVETQQGGLGTLSPRTQKLSIVLQ